MENVVKSGPPTPLEVWAQGKEVTSTVMTITPEIAAQMLKLSKGNRRIDVRRVRNYAETMKAGKFTLNNDAICFNADGTLVNGHHRLTACIKCGIPFQALVNRNMPTNSVYDRGKPRSIGDSLYMGKVIPKELTHNSYVAIANRYLEIQNGDKLRSVAEYMVGNFLAENKDYILKVHSMSGQGASKPIARKSPIETALFAALKSGVDENILNDFVTVVNSGYSSGDKQSAAVMLRNYLLTTPYSGATMSNKFCAITQLAIQDFVNGKPRKVMYRKLSFPYIPDAKLKLANGTDSSKGDGADA